MSLDMTRAPQPTRILIVDDSRAILAILRRTIQGIGYPVLDLRTACNGQQALDMLDRFVPDLVITDWHMPGMSGVELFQALKATGFQSITVGFVTTESSPRLLQEARRCGAGFILHKPFKDEDLVREITALVPVAGRDEAADAARSLALQQDRARARGTAGALASADGAGSDELVLETAAEAVDAAPIVLSSASASPGTTTVIASQAASGAGLPGGTRPQRAAGPPAELLSDRDATEVLRASMGSVPFKLVRQAGLKSKELGLRNLLCVYSAGGRAVAAVAVVDASAVCLIGGSAAALMPSAVRNAMSSGRPSDHMVEQTVRFLERTGPFLGHAVPDGEIRLAQHSLVPQDMGKLQKIVETATLRADFRLTAPGYGDGRISFVVVQPT